VLAGLWAPPPPPPPPPPETRPRSTLQKFAASPPVLLLPASPVWGCARQLSVLPHRGRLAPAPAVRHSNTRGWQAHTAPLSSAHVQPCALCSAGLPCPTSAPRSLLPARGLYICLVARARHAYPPSHYHLRSISCLLAFSSPHSPVTSSSKHIFFFFKKRA
jgi:hypothetical protein